MSSPYVSYLEIGLLLHLTEDGFRKSNGEEKSRDRKALGSEGQKDREVTAAGRSTLQTEEALSMHVRMKCKSTVEHERKSQRRESECIFMPFIYNVFSII